MFFLAKGPEKESLLYRKFVKLRVRSNERFYKELVSQNSRDQSFGSLYILLGHRYTGIQLYNHLVSFVNLVITTLHSCRRMFTSFNSFSLINIFS